MSEGLIVRKGLITITKAQTPEGVNDILQQECAQKRMLEAQIMDVFRSHAFFEVQTPMYEYYEMFANETGDIEPENLIKFIDKQGSILALRPDITTSIARIGATKTSHIPMPQRFCYFGSSFRESQAYQGISQNQFTQAGIELLGATSVHSDAEVIAVTIQALLAAGLNEFQLDMGHAGYQAAIAENNIILDLQSQFGGIEIIREQMGKLPEADDALRHLEHVYNALCDYGYEDYIAIDLGMGAGISYYSGIIVKGFARGLGVPICGGGRYDGLASEFGANTPATGIAIGIDRLLSVLPKTFVPYFADTIVCYALGARRAALKAADGLRKNGVSVQMWLEVDETNDAVDYAKRVGIGGVVSVINDDEIDIINISEGNSQRISIKELIGD